MLHSCHFKGIIIKHLAYLCLSYYFDFIINHFRLSRITCVDHLLRVFVFDAVNAEELEWDDLITIVIG